MKIKGTKKQKVLLAIQALLVIAVITLDILASHYNLNNVILLKIAEYCSFLVIFVLPIFILQDEKDDESEKNNNKK